MIGRHEIRTKYRRSLLGLFWLTLSMGIFVLGFGAVYSLLFRTDMSNLTPPVAAPERVDEAPLTTTA